MKILVLGGSGMLGHKLWQESSRRFDTWVTFRKMPAVASQLDAFNPARVIEGISAEDFDSTAAAIQRIRPDAVINCIGIIKQDAAAKNAVRSITVNSLYPHRVAEVCGGVGARMIHVSTDCVFTGQKGHYTEDDAPDAADIYGRSKLLGETTEPGAVTLRTSIIGHELSGHRSLVDWFLSQEGKQIRGFKRAIFSGFPTRVFAGIVLDVIEHHPALAGLWHVSADPISKYDLLMLVREAYGAQIAIEPDLDFFCDRSLDSSRFRQATGIVPPPWPEMIRQMHDDPTPYDQLKRSHATR